MLVQDGRSCLLAACEGGHLEVVKYLHGCGGEALLMLTNKVSNSELAGAVAGKKTSTVCLLTCMRACAG